MTDDTRAELRRAVGDQVRWCEAGGYVSYTTGPGLIPSVVVWGADTSDGAEPPPELTTAQHLALSVLVGEPDVPAAVLLGVLEDAGIYRDGVVRAAVEKAVVEERERVLKIIDAMLKTAPHPATNHLNLLKSLVHNQEGTVRMFRAAIDAIFPAVEAMAAAFGPVAATLAEFGRELQAAGITPEQLSPAVTPADPGR